MSQFDREIAVAVELIDNGQPETGFHHFITALESLHGKVDSHHVAIIERETKNGIAHVFNGLRFEYAEHENQFIGLATQFLEELNDKHITEGATPEFINFIFDVRDFTQNLI